MLYIIKSQSTRTCQNALMHSATQQSTFPMAIDYRATTTCHNLPQLTATCCGEMWWVVVSCGKPTTTYHKNMHLVVVSCGTHKSTTHHNSSPQYATLTTIHPHLATTQPHLATTQSHLTASCHNSFMICYNSNPFNSISVSISILLIANDVQLLTESTIQ